jgi:hypothetical protein
MVTSQYKWKFLERDVKQQIKKQTIFKQKALVEFRAYTSAADSIKGTYTASQVS